MFVNGDNIAQKEQDNTHYGDPLSKKMIAEIRKRYEIWKAENLKLIGPEKDPRANDNSIIEKRVQIFNEYKNFLDQKEYAEHFDSRSNLHSSALEEFIYYLFKDLVAEFSQDAWIGKCHAFKDIFFRSDNFEEMLKKPNIEIEKKDHDFVIGVKINADFSCQGSNEQQKEDLEIPAVAIECKTYLDKTMLEGSSTAGEQLKDRNPNALYIVVAERLKLTEAVNLKKYKVDQIYILRKQKNTDREYRYDPSYIANPIYPDVVENLFNFVRDYLKTDWHGKIADGLQRGYLI
jgi:hypothetical protein